MFFKLKLKVSIYKRRLKIWLIYNFGKRYYYATSSHGIIPVGIEAFDLDHNMVACISFDGGVYRRWSTHYEGLFNTIDQAEWYIKKCKSRNDEANKSLYQEISRKAQAQKEKGENK